MDGLCGRGIAEGVVAGRSADYRTRFFDSRKRTFLRTIHWWLVELPSKHVASVPVSLSRDHDTRSWMDGTNRWDRI